MIGVRGEKQFTADSRQLTARSQRRRKRDGNTEITETGTQRAQSLRRAREQTGAGEIVGAPTILIIVIDNDSGILLLFAFLAGI
jgi:hypothetical protein